MKGILRIIIAIMCIICILAGCALVVRHTSVGEGGNVSEHKVIFTFGMDKVHDQFPRADRATTATAERDEVFSGTFNLASSTYIDKSIATTKEHTITITGVISTIFKAAVSVVGFFV